MMNRAQLIGNLGSQPEIKSTSNGRRYARLSLATNETWRDKQTGEKKERVEWHTVMVWAEGLVGLCEKYLSKGSKVYLEGKISTRKWQDKDGHDRWSTEVVLQGFDSKIIMLDSKGSGRPDPQEPEGYSAADYQAAKSGEQTVCADLDDEIPF